MPDYKEMYFKLFRASEQAINILISAQRECEEMYMGEPELELKVFPVLTHNKKNTEEEEL